MLKILINNCKSKPTGHIFTSGDKSWISQGSDYLDWKSRQVAFVKSQLPKDIKPRNRVYGVIMRISIDPNRKGHPPDIYNLSGAVADILTQSGVWKDDNIRVSDLTHQRIVYNRSELTTIFICDNILEYIGLVLDELFFINP